MSSKHLDTPAMGLMFILTLIWGIQQVSLKAVATDITPIMAIGLRCGFSALLVAMLMLLRKESFSLFDGSLRPGLIMGVLFTLEFLFVAEGLRHTTAAHSVVFLYTAPIFAAVALHMLIPGEHLKKLQWLGIAVAFTGIAIAFLLRTSPSSGSTQNDHSAMLWGDFLALLSGASWGATTVVFRMSTLNKASANKTLLYQLAVGFMVLTSVAWFTGQSKVNPTPFVIATLSFHSLVVSFASYLAWFWLLKRYLANQLGVFSFLTPLFGVTFGVLLLGEPLETNFLIGGLCVLSGIVLVQLGKRSGEPDKN